MYMAHSSASSRVCLAALVTAGALGLLAQLPAFAVASLEDCAPIKVESNGLRTNLKTNVAELPGIVIKVCDARIEARMARTMKVEFTNSQWTFEGDVRIRMDEPQRSLKSDLAVVDFRNSQIQSLTITGKPAEFEQKGGESTATARGHAGKIVYDFSAGTVTLSDDAWISYGEGKELTSAQIVYDINRQAVDANPKAADPGGRVKFTIDPKAAKKGSGNSKATPPTGQQTPPTP